MKKVIFLGLGLVLLAAACNKQATTTDNTTTDNSKQETYTTPATDNGMDTIPPQTASVSITAAGFNPQKLTVKSGTVVVFKNDDTAGHWPASAPHPTHTDLPGFDSLKPIPPGGTYSYTFTKVGTWNYHDHLKASLFGSVTVTE